MAALSAVALTASLARAHPLDGAAATLVERVPSAYEVMRDYTWLGLEHLLTGYDHLLFVLGLMLLVRGLSGRLVSLTAFTLGHSLTLSFAALSWLEVPVRPVEIGIAASLVVLALEILAQQHRPAREPLRPWLMALSFGLLHGLGFATALAETGLPPSALPLSLFAFNLGLELAQLGLVLAVLPLATLCARRSPALVSPFERLAAWTIGGLAGYWCLERTLYAL